jgi:hypothetical protein
VQKVQRPVKIVQKVQRPVQKRGSRKYLIRWKVQLSQEELQKISRRPEVLERALTHVKRGMKKVEAEIYRIVPMDEVMSSAPDLRSASPKGIAIVEASSGETVKSMVDDLLEGLTFGGFPVARNYIEFDISPLVAIGQDGGDD